MIHPCLVSHLLAIPLRILRGLTCRRLQAFRTWKDNINTRLMCDRLVVIYRYFTYVHTLYYCVRLGTGHCWIRSFLLVNWVIMFEYWRYAYNYCVGQIGWGLELFRNVDPMSIRKYTYMNSKVSFRLSSLVDVQTLYTFLI